MEGATSIPSPLHPAWSLSCRRELGATLHCSRQRFPECPEPHVALGASVGCQSPLTRCCHLDLGFSFCLHQPQRCWAQRSTTSPVTCGPSVSSCTFCKSEGSSPSCWAQLLLLALPCALQVLLGTFLGWCIDSVPSPGAGCAGTPPSTPTTAWPSLLA